jgi:hypothetical protein
MFTIRQNTFETNSSSTHSICICTKDTFEKWKRGEVFNISNCWGDDYNILPQDRDFITKDEAIAFLKRYNPELDFNADDFDLEFELREYEIYSYDGWGEDYEHDTHLFKTPSGDEMVAECYYGYN